MAGDDSPRLSVVVPARNCAATLREALDALRSSDIARSEFEIIVVDDGSSDDTAAVATTLADVVIRLEGGPHGPAAARNAGAEVARASFIAFVDADVCVHAHTLRGMVEHLENDEALGAVFGAYDTSPAAPGLVSQYRNLVHHWEHARHAGEAATFWAGCGAMRTAAFRQVGGFDAARYARPQIEDIELGHRLRRAGWRILLDPALQGRHLKRWTLRGGLVTDIRDRGVPWAHLAMAGVPGRRLSELNLNVTARLATALTGAGVLACMFALVLRDVRWLIAAAAAALLALVPSLPLFRWLVRIRGPWFALGAVPLRLLYYLSNGLSALIAGWHAAPAQRATATRYIHPMHDGHTSVAADEVERELELAFAPLHKAAFGVAIGAAGALVLFLLTAARLLLDAQGRTDLSLLAQYLAGYEQSWTGALIGAAWGFFIGFVSGWFFAFTRNLVLAVWLLVMQARADLAVARDFLDHV